MLKLAWKDQNVILFMSTVTNGLKRITRQRRRPGATSTNAHTSRKPFIDPDGKVANVKALEIPEFIDLYNHFMGGVDQANQLQSYYTTQRTHYKP